MEGLKKIKKRKSKMKPLNPKEIKKELSALKDWEFHDDKIQKKFVLKDFAEAFAFLGKVALIAEKQNHHPEIFNVYNRVELKFNTHDAGNKVTEKDIKIAKTIEELF